MTSESFGCHDISRHRLGASARWERDGRAAASACRIGAAPVALVVADVVWLHCTWVGCYWRRVGCTLSRWGLRAVGTTLGQWIPTLRGAGLLEARLKAEPASNHDHRDPAQMAGREWCRRTCEKGAGLYRTNHGLSPLRGLVSTVLTLTGPASMLPAGIVGILRFFFVVWRRCACGVSTVDTHAPSCLVPQPPSPPGPPACPGFLPERVSQKS